MTALARQHHDPALLRCSAESADAEAERARRVSAMFDDHYDAIWRTLRRLGIPDADVDDAAQHVFVTAARRIDTIELGHEGRYLYGIAVRVASELRRRAPSRHEVADDGALAKIADDAPGPEQVLLENEARDALDATLADMTDDLRAVLVLVEIEGLSVADLAASLEVPVGTAASRLRRAREAFTASARRVRARLEFAGTKGAER
jgi:RNA polymerase sigma-70 factor, ECF subfamily